MVNLDFPAFRGRKVNPDTLVNLDKMGFLACPVKKDSVVSTFPIHNIVFKTFFLTFIDFHQTKLHFGF